MLARQHDIDNLGKQLRAQALLLDEARTRATRAGSTAFAGSPIRRAPAATATASAASFGTRRP